MLVIVGVNWYWIGWCDVGGYWWNVVVRWIVVCVCWVFGFWKSWSGLCIWVVYSCGWYCCGIGMLDFVKGGNRCWGEGLFCVCFWVFILCYDVGLCDCFGWVGGEMVEWYMSYC